MTRYSIICAVNKPKVFEENLFMSPGVFAHELIVQTKYTNICKAYNDAIQSSTSDILIFVHQDVYLPRLFFDQLKKSLEKLANVNWGVIGPAGRNCLGELKGNILDRAHLWGAPLDLPAPVQTLDELCLILKRSTFDKLAFDEKITNQHLFGTDICLQAESQGLQNFAVLAFCSHNSTQDYHLPKEFKDTSNYIKTKWRAKLPIYSTCQIII